MRAASISDRSAQDLVARFLLLAEALPEPLFLVSRAGQIIAANRKTSAFIGVKREEFVGQPIARYVEDSDDTIEGCLRSASRTNLPVPMSLSWRHHKDGGRHWSSHAFVLRTAVDDPPGYVVFRCTELAPQTSGFLSLNMNLAKQQVALQRLQRSRSLLEKEHEKVVVTLRSIGEAVISTDRDGVIESINPVAERLTGWHGSTALGQPISKVFTTIDEATRLSIPDPVVSCLRGEYKHSFGDHTALLARDGAEYAIENSATPICTELGDVLGAVLVFRDVTDRRLSSRQIEHQADHDALTGLHNRDYFERQIQHAVDSAQRGEVQHVLLYVDLDQFKLVNESAGHRAGDDLLGKVARRFASNTRRGDTLARIGGDEFGVLIHNAGASKVERIAESFKESLKKLEFHWEGQAYEVTSSMGATLIDKHTVSPGEVMRRADVARYVAKRDGRNRWHAYVDSDESAILGLGEINVLRLVKEALANDGFELHFQPIISVSDQSILMYEALLRMRRSGGGFILPNTFIPIAERHGLMHEVDLWVIEAALAKLRQRYQDGQPISLTVNLSGTSLTDRSLLDPVKKELAKGHVPPAAFALEVTETAAVGHLEHAAQFVRDLRALGCSFALDDFGTGFSSFGYLKHLAADYIKIDGSFVRDMASDPVDQAMVRSINHIAHSLNKKTIAEFVENEQTLEQLKEFGVDYAQGYFVGHPGPL